MALSVGDRVIAQHRQSGLEAAFAAAPAPQMLASDIVMFLRKRHADAALTRLRAEISLLNECDGEDYGLSQRIFAAEQTQQDVRTDLESIRDGRIGQTAEAQAYAREAEQRADGRLQELAEQLAGMRARRTSASARARALSARVKACQTLVRRMIGGNVSFRVIPPPDVGKLTLAVARERIAQIEADSREIAAAPPTAGEVKELVTAWLERKACKPHVAPLFDRDGGGEPFVPGYEHAGRWVPDVVGLLLWLNRDKIVAELHADADRLADAHALDAATREKKLADNKKQKLVAERVEELLVWRALQAGEPIVPREDADPRAILGIE